MREELFKWVSKTFGEEGFMGFLEYNEHTVNKLAKDTRIYKITEIKCVVGIAYEEVSKEKLEKWQGELIEIFQIAPLTDRFSVEVDHSKRLVTPGDIDAKFSNKNNQLGDLVEKRSLLIRFNVFKKRPYKE